MLFDRGKGKDKGKVIEFYECVPMNEFINIPHALKSVKRIEGYYCYTCLNLLY
jgi:hypothetical protein